MTKKEALKSLVDYEVTDDNLFDKVLTDHGLTGSDTYASTDRQELDMCLIDILNYLAAHPEIKDGQSSIKFDSAHLRASAKEIMNRYPNIATSTRIARGLGGTVSAKTLW